MDIINIKVKHKYGFLGEGVVTGLEGDHVRVAFATKEIVLKYPHSFGDSIFACDEKIAKKIEAEKQRLLSEEQRKRDEEVATQQNMPSLDRRKSLSEKRADRPNIAFKCTYCDGGKCSSSLGFNGVCSERNICRNIEEGRSWCSNEDSDCRLFYDEEISRRELEDRMDEYGSVCYESVMLSEWKASAGVHHSGPHRGETIKLRGVGTGSLCVLTTRLPNTTEEERLIFAVFLVDRAYDGDEEQAGFVQCESKYKISLTPKEAAEMPFWKYHSNENSPELCHWGTGLVRYLEDVRAVQILRDIAGVKKGTRDEALALEFLEKFCKFVGIPKDRAGEPFGALTL